jgi:hypothetical protein
MLLAEPLNEPAASGAPVMVALEIVIPGPASSWAKAVAFNPLATVSWANALPT